MHKTNYKIFSARLSQRGRQKIAAVKKCSEKIFSRQLIAALNSGNKAGAFFLHVDSSWKMLYNKDIKKERTTTMARHYRFLGRKSRPYTSVGALMVTASTKKSSRRGWLFSCSKTAKRCGRYVTYILMQKHQSQFAPLFQLFVKPYWLPW